jgi:hypothetical protein
MGFKLVIYVITKNKHTNKKKWLVWRAAINVNKNWEECNKWQITVRYHKNMNSHVYAYSVVLKMFTQKPDNGLQGLKYVAYIQQYKIYSCIWQ